MPEEGIWVYASLIDLGEWMGEPDTANVSRVMKSLREERCVLRISQGKARKGSLYLIPRSLISENDLLGERGLDGSKDIVAFCSCVALLSCKSEGSLYKELVWVRKGERGLTEDQKRLFEVMLFCGINDLDDLSSITGIRKDNLKRRVVNHLISLELIEYESDRVKLSDDYEKVVHRVFVESGGEKALLEALEKFENQRNDFYAVDGEEAT